MPSNEPTEKEKQEKEKGKGMNYNHCGSCIAAHMFANSDRQKPSPLPYHRFSVNKRISKNGEPAGVNLKFRPSSKRSKSAGHSVQRQENASLLPFNHQSRL
jgi:hypothetical protein